MKLHVVIEKDEVGYYVAEVPALPGCLSQGKTYEEAIANVTEAVEGWLEVMESKYASDFITADKALYNATHKDLPWVNLLVP